MAWSPSFFERRRCVDGRAVASIIIYSLSASLANSWKTRPKTPLCPGDRNAAARSSNCQDAPADRATEYQL
jgi:hypothetical protein